MNKEEWLRWRKNGIGGSDAAIILKKFPFGKTPLMLYNEKISHDLIHIDTPAMAHGRENEDRALDWFEKKMGCALFRQIRVENKETPYIRATLDGLDLDEKFMVEAKCPFNLENHEKVKNTKKIPDIYYPQCQHQLKTKELDGMYYESFNSQDPEDSIILEVQRDNKFIAEMLPEYERFWNCVQNRIPPESTEFDFFCKEEDEYWLHIEEKYNEALQWAEKADYWRKELIKLSEGKNSQGPRYRVTHSPCDGHIDYDAIPELIGVDKEAYRKPSYIRTSVRSIKS